MSSQRLLVASLVLVGSAAHADTFGGWQYTAPPGYTTQVNTDHVALTKITGSTFCSIALFEARTLDGPVRAERAFEWHNVVTHQFNASVKRRTTMQTKRGAQVAATVATLRTGEGTYGAVHYVVMPPGMIGSVLLTSDTSATLKSCEPVASALVGSLAIDWSAPQFNDPEARVQTPEGRWAVAGASSREYTFAADGSYRFYSEVASAPRVRVVVERGTYTMLGNQLTVKPVAASSYAVDGGVVKHASRMPLEPTTYTWGKRYVVETNEWQLVLESKKATKRDGARSPTTKDYRYSDRAKPQWKFAPVPGV